MNWKARTFSLPFVSTVYLALPFFLFFFGWLTWYWSFLFSVVLLVALGSMWFDENMWQQSRARGDTLRDGLSSFLYLALAIVVLIILISGIGGWGYQESDWNKHNLVLRDLIARDWPVVYSFYGRPVGLVYYIGYYLPAALIGKWTDWSFANSVLAIWSAAGLFLALYWFRLLVNRQAWWIPFIFLLFSGLDLIGWSLTALMPVDYLPDASWPEQWISWHRWDSYVSRWQYGAHLLSLFWAPNQALAAWCATSVFYFTSLVVGTRRYAVLIWSLLLFWSPFAAIGLVPLLLTDLFFADVPWPKRIRGGITLPNVCGALIFGLLAAFYLTKAAPILSILDDSFRSTFFFLEVDGWRDRLLWMPVLLLFYLLEFGVYAFFIIRTDVFDTARTKWLFGGVLVWLMLIPLYVYGKYNDFAIRASIPALFFLSILVARSLYASRGRTWLRAVLLAVLLVSALNPLHQAAFHIYAIAQRGEWRHFRLSERRPDLVTSYAVDFQLARQYVSSLDTSFFHRFGPLDRAHVAVDSISTESYWLFDSAIIVEDPVLERRMAAPSDCIALLVPFKAVEQTGVNYSLATRIVGADGRLLWDKQNWPAGRPSSEWEPSRTTQYDERTISVPADVLEGYYRLEVYIADPETQDKMAVVALPDGRPIGDLLVADYLIVGDPDVSVRQPFADIHFANQISLEGTGLPADVEAGPGEILPVRLVWRALQRPQADYVGFVHLLDEDGQLVAQQDRPPLDGQLPTSIWQPGLTIADDYSLALPDDLPPGRYTLVAGLYQAETGERLVLEGTTDNLVVVGTLTVP